MLVIEWKTDDWDGGKDFLPSHWFEKEGAWPYRSHAFRSPKGRRFTARCSVTTAGRVVEIDYGGEHTKFNERDSSIGTLKLTFDDETRETIETVEWRYVGPDQTFKTYEVGIGQSDLDRAPTKPFDPSDQDDNREMVERTSVQRRGQPAFRDDLMDAYERRCAITGWEIEEVLEAAHIISYKGPQTDHVRNGLLLRADIHTLFDCGLIRVNPDYSIDAPIHIRDKYELPKTLMLPRNPASHPDPKALAEKLAKE